MSFLQDHQHRAVSTSSTKVVFKGSTVFRTPTVTKRTSAFTSTDNTGINDLSLFTSQSPRGPFPPPFPSSSTGFQGNPNVAISAINTGGGIVASRLSGSIPVFIQASASAITATGTSNPYEDLEYKWNFGDPSGTEVFTDPSTGGSVNMNTDQTGPEAVYCYRSVGSGTYTITLSIRGKNSGAYTTTSITQNITVSAFSHSGGEFWFDQVNGNDGNNGTSSGTPKQSIAALNALIGSNKQFHLAKGSNWSGTTGINWQGGIANGLRFDTYGSGVAPIVSVSSGANAAFILDNSSGAHDDWVMSGITFTDSGTATGGIILVNTTNSATNQNTNIYFDNCILTETLNVAGTARFVVTFDLGSNALMNNIGIWGGSVSGPLTTPANANRLGIYGGGRNWIFYVGFPISGAGSSTTFDHHIYPQCQNHLCIKYVNFGSGPQRNYCINTNWDRVAASGQEIAQYLCFSNNLFNGTLEGFDGSNGDEDPTKVRFQNFVVQQNAVTGLSGLGFGYFVSCTQSITLRDNKLYNCSSPVCLFFPNTTANGAFLTPTVYRNWIYRTGNNSGNAVINANSDPAVSTFAKWSVTDNIIQDTFTSANIFDPITASFVSAGALIDRNQYYAPNDSDAKFLASTPITFTAWQAIPFDANGKVQNPNWPNPVNGDFGPWPLFS